MGKVSFIGAGPGDPELITIKAVKLIKKADIILYAGSLVPKEVITEYSDLEDDKIINTAGLTIEETHAIVKKGAEQGKNIARLHTGDPSIYGAINEQMSLLDRDGITYEVIPGISSAMAAAAALKTELTVPGSTQTIIFTRIEGRTPVPESEKLSSLAAHGASIIVFLSAHMVDKVTKELSTHYSPDTPAAIVYRVGWPDSKVLQMKLEEVPKVMKAEKIERQALIMVGPGLTKEKHLLEKSKLYDKNFHHGYRNG